MLPKLIGETLNDFTESLALKSLALMAGLCFLVVCGTCCSGCFKQLVGAKMAGKQKIVIE